MQVCYLLDELEIDIDKLFLRMTPSFMYIGKENISGSNILKVVVKLLKLSKCEAIIHLSYGKQIKTKGQVKSCFNSLSLC